jgi:hypothetical protein
MLLLVAMVLAAAFFFWLFLRAVPTANPKRLIARTGRPSRVDFGRWGYVTARSHRGRPGRIHMLSA